jgi:uncharacterized membrane protein YesL
MNRYSLKDLFKTAADIAFLNFLFFAAILVGAFVTFGAAYKAMFAVMFKLLDKDRATYVAKEFWIAFKDDFLFVTLLWIGFASIGVSLSFICIYALSVHETIVATTTIVSAVMTLSFFLVLFPMLGRVQAKSRMQMLKNAVLLGVSHPVSVLMLLGGVSAGVLLFVWWNGTVLISFGLVTWINAMHLNRVFQELAPKPVQSMEE